LVAVAAGYGGKGCPPLHEERTCKSQACPVDCVQSAFTHWTECDATCGGGWQMRYRSIEDSALSGGKPCGVLFEKRKCAHDPCVTNCEVSEWGIFGPCSETCAGTFVPARPSVSGLQIRKRKVTTLPMHDGMGCPVLTEARECSSHTPCLKQPLRLRGLGRAENANPF
jgi:hypothetical protein